MPQSGLENGDRAEEDQAFGETRKSVCKLRKMGANIMSNRKVGKIFGNGHLD